MASFTVSNPKGSAAILYAADYLAKKYVKAAEQYGKPLSAIESEFLDENGKRWKLSFGPVNESSQTPAPDQS